MVKRDWIYFFILVNDPAKSPAGMDIILKLVNSIIPVKIFPPGVIGYMSPYPTVVSVTTAHQRAWGIDSKTLGWAWYSK